MDKPILYANDLSRPDFIETIKNHRWQTKPIVIAFTLEQAYFHEFTFDNYLFNQTTEGRVFSEEGEMKWRKIGDKLRVAYFGFITPPPKLNKHKLELEGLKKEESRFILWGRRYVKDGVRTNEWIEHQVPHRFTYPVVENKDENDRVSLIVENWTNNVGKIIFSRYQSIVEISEVQ